MSQRLLAGMSALARTGVFICFLISLFGSAALATAAGQEPAAKDASSKELFGATKILSLHLEIPAKEYEAMQPPAAAAVPLLGSLTLRNGYSWAKK